jgi:CO/xanthine dehydrogenase Mo-binding subunit
VHPDTDVTPYDMATLGSRSTYHMGNAVRRAAEDARDKVVAMAREVGLPDDSRIEDVFRKRYGMKAGTIVGTGQFVPSYAPTDHHTGQSPTSRPTG